MFILIQQFNKAPAVLFPQPSLRQNWAESLRTAPWLLEKLQCEEPLAVFFLDKVSSEVDPMLASTFPAILLSGQKALPAPLPNTHQGPHHTLSSCYSPAGH